MIDEMVLWASTGSNLLYAAVLALALWIGYEYLVDLVIRLPRLFIIGTIMYFVLKTFMGAPLP